MALGDFEDVEPLRAHQEAAALSKTGLGASARGRRRRLRHRRGLPVVEVGCYRSWEASAHLRVSSAPRVAYPHRKYEEPHNAADSARCGRTHIRDECASVPGEASVTGTRSSGPAPSWAEIPGVAAVLDAACSVRRPGDDRLGPGHDDRGQSAALGDHCARSAAARTTAGERHTAAVASTLASPQESSLWSRRPTGARTTMPATRGPCPGSWPLTKMVNRLRRRACRWFSSRARSGSSSRAAASPRNLPVGTGPGP